MKRKHNIPTETLLKVGLDCNRNFSCLNDKFCKKIDDVVVCNNPENDKCMFRFGTTLPNPMCMCWVKTEKDTKK